MTNPPSPLVERLKRVRGRLQHEFDMIAVCHCGDSMKDHHAYCGHSPVWNPDRATELLDDAQTALRDAAAEIERMEGALQAIAERRTWAGVWQIGCECERRLPEIFDIADAALARKEAE